MLLLVHEKGEDSLIVVSRDLEGEDLRFIPGEIPLLQKIRRGIQVAQGERNSVEDPTGKPSQENHDG